MRQVYVRMAQSGDTDEAPTDQQKIELFISKMAARRAFASTSSKQKYRILPREIASEFSIEIAGINEVAHEILRQLQNFAVCWNNGTFLLVFTLDVNKLDAIQFPEFAQSEDVKGLSYTSSDEIVEFFEKKLFGKRDPATIPEAFTIKVYDNAAVILGIDTLERNMLQFLNGMAIKIRATDTDLLSIQLSMASYCKIIESMTKKQKQTPRRILNLFKSRAPY